VLWLVKTIINSGAVVLNDEYVMHWFADDDLFAALRPRGLPIGNLTSQFWSNCYLDSLDHFVKREIRCKAYLRYVDDMALLIPSKRKLWRWKENIIEHLATLRLTVHPQAQVTPVEHGIPWLGFTVYSTIVASKPATCATLTVGCKRVGTPTVRARLLLPNSTPVCRVRSTTSATRTVRAYDNIYWGNH
jgi:hypothetical protein